MIFVSRLILTGLNIIRMEIIEKKVYEEGRGGYDRDRDRGTRERANAGLTLGIIGTVLGAAALWGRGNGIGSILGGGSSGGAGSPANVNINAYGASSGSGCVSPTPFQAFEKECGDVLALTNEMWGLKVGTMQAATAAREVDVAEKFGLYKAMTDADFGLYKNNRDNIDAIRPYQDKLIQCEIDKAFTAGINYTDRKTCKMVEGVVVVPNEPTITGYGSYCCFRNNTAAGGGSAA